MIRKKKHSLRKSMRTPCSSFGAKGKIGIDKMVLDWPSYGDHTTSVSKSPSNRLLLSTMCGNSVHSDQQIETSVCR